MTKEFDFDQERYTTAMIALGFARGLISRIYGLLDAADALPILEDIHWLDKRIERVFTLNDEAENVGRGHDAGPKER